MEWSGERGGITPLIISPIKTAEKYKLGSGARELTSPIQANNGSFPLGSQGGLWGEEGEEREGMWGGREVKRWSCCLTFSLFNCLLDDTGRGRWLTDVSRKDKISSQATMEEHYPNIFSSTRLYRGLWEISAIFKMVLHTVVVQLNVFVLIISLCIDVTATDICCWHLGQLRENIAALSWIHMIHESPWRQGGSSEQFENDWYNSWHLNVHIEIDFVFKSHVREF